MITIVAKFILMENKKYEFIKTAQELILKSNEEEGCISYDLYEDINDENIVTFIEVWRSKEDIDIHNETEHFKRIVPKLGELKKDNVVNLYQKI